MITTSGSGATYTAVIPKEFAVTERDVEVKWGFTFNNTAYTDSQTYRIVTPYVDYADFGPGTDADMSQTDFAKSERLVRYIIDNYTGQSFGKSYEIYDAEGTGDDGLILPKHIIEVYTVAPKSDWYNVIDVHDPLQWTYVSPSDAYEPSADGWILRRASYYQDLSVVHEPHNVWQRNIRYSIGGLWGYDSVPGPVQTAAELLMSYYDCRDEGYRDKYLKNMKADNWRIEYTDDAYIGTGLVKADQLLNEYRMFPRVGVI